MTTHSILAYTYCVLNKVHFDFIDTEFTFEQATAQAFSFFIGGFETSSSTLQFTMFELALNQEIQKRLRQEVKTTLAKYNNEVTYEGVMGMEYMGRVIDGMF